MSYHSYRHYHPDYWHRPDRENAHWHRHRREPYGEYRPHERRHRGDYQHLRRHYAHYKPDQTWGQQQYARQPIEHVSMPWSFDQQPQKRFSPSPNLNSFANAGTAIYDISACRVYLPDGTQLEAHSGLGTLKDDPRSIGARNRGATPTHLYDLTMREGSFHGVQALRLNPVGEGAMYGRTGLLAHSFMLGPNGDSNGCVSFRDYEKFLQAYQSGQVKRLKVVASL